MEPAVDLVASLNHTPPWIRGTSVPSCRRSAISWTAPSFVSSPLGDGSHCDAANGNRKRRHSKLLHLFMIQSKGACAGANCGNVQHTYAFCQNLRRLLWSFCGLGSVFLGLGNWAILHRQVQRKDSPCTKGRFTVNTEIPMRLQVSVPSGRTQWSQLMAPPSGERIRMIPVERTQVIEQIHIRQPCLPLPHPEA